MSWFLTLRIGEGLKEGWRRRGIEEETDFHIWS